MARIHAAAALWHCCRMLRALEHAHASGEEMVARLISRSLVESFLVGMYLAVGGGDAMEAVRSDYHASLLSQQRAIDEHDETVRRRRKHLTKRNKRIARANLDIAQRNRANPDLSAIPEHAALSVSDTPTIDLDMSAAIAQVADATPRKLPLSELVERIRAITQGSDDEASFGVVYNMVYRSLSAFGAHPTMWVLNSYLDNRDGEGVFVRVRDEPDAGAFAQPNLQTGLLSTANLAQKVLGGRGAQLPYAESILELLARLASP